MKRVFRRRHKEAITSRAESGHAHRHGTHEYRDNNKAFYDAKQGTERKRFESEPSKIVSAERLIPWLTLQLKPGATVLDIGGGAGSHASKLTRAAGVIVTGVDISESAIRERKEDPLLKNAVGDMESLPFSGECFDSVLFIACLHHVPDPLPALREARRVLRPGGQLLASEPSSLRAGRKGVRPTEDGHEFAVSSAWLVRMIREAGFSIEEIDRRRLSARFLARLTPQPSLRSLRITEKADRFLLNVPGLNRLASLSRIRARKY